MRQKRSIPALRRLQALRVQADGGRWYNEEALVDVGPCKDCALFGREACLFGCGCFEVLFDALLAGEKRAFLLARAHSTIDVLIMAIVTTHATRSGVEAPTYSYSPQIPPYNCGVELLSGDCSHAIQSMFIDHRSGLISTGGCHGGQTPSVSSVVQSGDLSPSRLTVNPYVQTDGYFTSIQPMDGQRSDLLGCDFCSRVVTTTVITIMTVPWESSGFHTTITSGITITKYVLAYSSTTSGALPPSLTVGHDRPYTNSSIRPPSTAPPSLHSSLLPLFEDGTASATAARPLTTDLSRYGSAAVATTYPRLILGTIAGVMVVWMS
ncbi:hypothetical protein M409DRAFT_61568 [Zasmidium cellare ATCC 36951]|uniref:Uncharacterized protein n=1 Tax=Zasmidium cellare ATCC 36951 TaxID=1080233 RepID=A0A6A6BYR2_ZASCE|nr:uncharacterized protein M409DRAFT_61568 [Zasmidium cellare ATCC 36951]KAF2158556.1 hypothetical protein M409DRAFT_61568 [Zasmidium cellare ATCC 36951]